MKRVTDSGRVYYEDLWGNTYAPADWFHRELVQVLHEGRVGHGDTGRLAEAIADLIDAKIEEALKGLQDNGYIPI